ncbi:MAG TPA: type II secretion system F family protein [bacterium]|nr:type II secretion system F family protein [bacterium]
MAGIDNAGRMQRSVLPLRPRGRPAVSRPGTAMASTMPGAGAARLGRRRIGPADVAMLTYDLSMLLNAGLPLMQALEVLGDQATELQMRDVLHELSQEIQEGRRFSEALGRYPELFSPLYRGIVTNGEASGRLDLALERLATFLERDLEFRKKIRDVLIYPAMVLSMAAFVLCIFLIYIIPAFERVYHRAGASLPFLTRVLLAWSRTARVGLPVTISAGALLFLPQARRWLRQTGGATVQRIVLRLPHAGVLAQTALLGRFAHSMSMMLGSGVPLLSALEVAGAIGGPPEFASMVEGLSRSVIQGRRLSEAMRVSGWFTPMFLRMVSVGEETGRLDLMVARAAAILDREFDVRMRRFLTLLEPILILLVGAFVGVILMALYLPMFGLARGLAH